MMASQASVRTFGSEMQQESTTLKDPPPSNNAPTQESLLNLERDLAVLGGPSSKEEKREPAPSPAATKPRATGGKNALLARVQAAQERARLAQEAKKRAMIELEKARLEEEKIMKGLEEELEQEDSLFDTLNAMSPPPTTDAPTMSLLEDPLPPPPPMDTNVIPCAPPPPASMTMDENDLSQLLPVPPPATTTHTEDPPPSFEQFVQTQAEADPDALNIDLEAFQFDDDGNELTREQQIKLLKEQEEILNQIKQEQEANDKAIAELTRNDSPPAAAAATAVAGAASGQRIHIAPDKCVSLHGQERTKAAIADGTAALVQCVYCQNWMQVTPSASLMFCPVCQVVSPVQHQSSVLTTDDAVRMSLDRKMAEKMQSDMWKEQREDANETTHENKEDGILGKLKASIWGESEEAVLVTNHSANNNTDTKQSWGEYISSLMLGAEENKDVPNQGSAEIVVGARARSHPTPAQVYGKADTTNNTSENEEQSSLLPGRVAESKPLFSCVVESVSHILSQPQEIDHDGQVNGVDATSLLGITEVGRNVGGGSGEYTSVSSNEV